MTFLNHVAAATAVLAFAAPAFAEYPEKAINLIVGFRAGGGSDAAARILAAELEAQLGRKVIVENKGGAGGAVAAQYIMGQSPDGYTIGFAVNTTFSYTPLTGNVAYGIDDVDYIATSHGYRVVYTAPKDAPFDDWAGMIATAKERGWINYASIIPLDRAVIQYVGKKEEVAVNVVPTRGGSAARQAVLGGHVDLGFSGSNALPMYEDGAMKVIASMNPGGISEHPDIPTLEDLGYDVFMNDAAVFFGPKGMDETARATLEAALADAVKSDAFVDFVNNKFRGSEGFKTGAETRATLEADAVVYTEMNSVIAE
ncbi:MAG: tripartite tricarboxylate transporter substrate binding protein [Pseudomonadota bacterium]